MGPIGVEALSGPAQALHSVVREESERVVEPGRTPPLPIMALRMVDSLRMHAVSATCSGLPAASRRW